MKVIIAESDPNTSHFLKLLVEKLPEINHIFIVDNGEELINKVATIRPNFVIVDTDISKDNGLNAINTIKVCRTIQPFLPVIFISNYKHYAFDAYEIGAMDYILKPIDTTRLFTGLSRVVFMHQLINEKKTKKNLTLKQKNNKIYIPLNEILFIEKRGKSTYTHLSHKIIESKETLKEIQRHLNSQFILGHRSYIINLEKLEKIEREKQVYIAHFSNYPKTAKISKHNISLIKKKVEQNNPC